MKRLTQFTVMLFLALSCMGVEECDDGCGTSKAEKADRAQADEQQLLYQKTQPVPKMLYSQERDAITQLYLARNKNVYTHTIWRGDTSIIEYDCPSIGYPLPYDTSLTNPLQAYGNGSAYTSIEMAEPNGLFSSKNSIATWARCIGPEGRIEAIYIEAKLTAFPFPLKVNYETNRVTRAGPASYSLSMKSEEEVKKK